MFRKLVQKLSDAALWGMTGSAATFLVFFVSNIVVTTLIPKNFDWFFFPILGLTSASTVICFFSFLAADMFLLKYYGRNYNE